MTRYLIVLILIFISSCKEKRQNKEIASELKSFYGRNIIYTDNLRYVFDTTAYFNNFTWEKQYKIISYIDISDCTPCSLESIFLWKNFTKQLADLNTEIIIILKSKQISEINEILTNRGIHIPVFIDENGIFKYTNHIPENPLLQTFLLDKNNNVVLVGMPIQNEKSWQLYKKVIHQLQ